MRSDRTPPARRYWIAFLLVIAGILVGAWHNRTTGVGRTDPVSGVAQMIVAQPAKMVHGISGWIGGQTGWLFRTRALASENVRLRNRVEELERQNTELTDMARRYEQLRSDLGFVHPLDPRPLAADVVARRVTSDFDTIVISRGSQDGVHTNSVVRTRTGLVGKVSEVSAMTATVILLTDPNGAVGGRIQRAGAHDGVGVCKGDYGALVPMIDLPTDSDIKPGDLVVTSGFGTVVAGGTKKNPHLFQTYPKGIPIGTVVSVKDEEGTVGKIARLKPIVDFGRLEEVYVLP